MGGTLTPPDDADVERAVDALKSVRRGWMRRPGVTAVDVGFKISGEELTNDLAVRVHVERKLSVAQLDEAEVFNESGREPKKVGGFPVDVIEATYGPAAAVVLDPDDADAAEAVDRRSRLTPLLGGISCGNPRVTAGTLATIVYDIDDCSPHILSNWHVLAGDVGAVAGEPIWQPGKADGGTAGDVVATLNRFRLDAQMDAATARLNGQRTFVRDVLGVGSIAGTTAPTLGMQVMKSGRTTSVTRGVIDGVATSVRINYGGSAGTVTLNDQFHVVPRPPWPAVDYEVSQGGDSGSVWLNEVDLRAVGLHFAGETDPAPIQENAIATPIERVAMALRFSFLPVVCRPSRPVVVPRDLIRLILCRRFPWLCRPIPIPPIPAPPFPLGPGPDPPPFPLASLVGQFDGGSRGAGSVTRELIDEVLDDIEDAFRTAGVT